MARAKTSTGSADTPAYVALLRGINVGGNNIIPMTALAKAFEDMSFRSVKTIIQSGNVLFRTSERDVRALERRIEKALSKAFRYDATVVVRSQLEMAAVVDGLPRAWKRVDEETRYNVVFLRHEIDSETILDGLSPKPRIESVAYRPGVLYWSARVANVSRTAMVKLSSMPIYRQVTVRNLNTTKKIFDQITTLG